MDDNLIFSLEQVFNADDEVTGHLARMSDDRLVFIGQHKDERDCWYIGFRNREGEDTRMRLSKDAMAMLVQMYNSPLRGNDVFPLKVTTQWAVRTEPKSTPAPQMMEE